MITIKDNEHVEVLLNIYIINLLCVFYQAETHFPAIHRLTNIPYHEMMFFDDCNWEDNCGNVEQRCRDGPHCLGPVIVRTPQGLTVDHWYHGLELYQQRIASITPGISESV